MSLSALFAILFVWSAPNERRSGAIPSLSGSVVSRVFRCDQCVCCVACQNVFVLFSPVIHTAHTHHRVKSRASFFAKTTRDTSELLLLLDYCVEATTDISEVCELFASKERVGVVWSPVRKREKGQTWRVDKTQFSLLFYLSFFSFEISFVSLGKSDVSWPLVIILIAVTSSKVTSRFIQSCFEIRKWCQTLVRRFVVVVVDFSGKYELLNRSPVR